MNMKVTKPLVNLALLETLKSHDIRDEIDLFLPFIVIAVQHIDHVPFDAQVIKDRISEIFFTNVPGAAIDVLIARALKRKILVVKNHAYFPNTSVLNEWVKEGKKGTDNSDAALDGILSKFVEYARRHFCKEISILEAESLLYSFLRDNIGDAALMEISGNISENVKNNDQLTAGFLAYLHREGEGGWNDLKVLLRRVMLASYLSYADQISSRKDYSNISVYLDTPILIGLLGFSGIIKQKAYQEMIRLLTDFKAKIYVFHLTLQETEGILAAWKNDLERRRYGKFNPKTLELLRQQNIDSVSLDTHLKLLESRVTGMGIEIQRGFKLKTRYNCDVKALELQIKSKFVGDSVDPSHDADVLNRIYNTREEKKINTFNDKFSVFVTPNTALVNIAQDFFTVIKGGVPCAVTDKWLTTMFWFKNPDVFNDLPLKILISNAYGKIFCSDKFWSEFASRLEGLVKHNKITEEEFVLVRYDSDLLVMVHEASVDKGMEFSDKDIFDIVESIKRKHIEDKDNEIRALAIESDNRIAQLTCDKGVVEAQLSYVVSKVDKAISGVSFAVGWLVSLTLIAFFVIVAIASIPKEILPDLDNDGIQESAYYGVIFFVVFVLELLGKIKEVSLSSIRSSVRVYIKNWLTKKMVGE